MRKQRTISQYTTIKHDNKRHCPEDLACEGCCSCVEQYKNQIKILRDKLDKVSKENVELEKMLFRLNKNISEFEKRKKEFDKIDDFKLKVRETIKKEL
jgi:phage shock protein A